MTLHWVTRQLAPAGLVAAVPVCKVGVAYLRQVREMLAVVRGHFDHVVVTRYATNPRAASVTQLVNACRQAGLPAPQVATTPVEALRVARSLATPRGMVCVAGSFFLAAEIRAAM